MDRLPRINLLSGICSSLVLVMAVIIGINRPKRITRVSLRLQAAIAFINMARLIPGISKFQDQRFNLQFYWLRYTIERPHLLVFECSHCRQLAQSPAQVPTAKLLVGTLSLGSRLSLTYYN
ncbi:hypothetical protein DSO57_1008569 [Entomophthora muscae]|uniref:Uncharacterized protein n=1 Tax=Entomophthora muscae TaxID=34485 RepID=A0ACC2RLR1_9FUNG|nr:hypothetical protein DSO57_1008569 [Entomophthora muscae]